jgi:hypothetical protein
VATHFRPHQISLTDTQLIDLPRPQKASGIAMFCGDVHLPRRCPHTGSAVRPRPVLAHVDQPLAMRANWHVICITHNPKEAGMWMLATLGIGTVHISGEAIFR